MCPGVFGFVRRTTQRSTTRAERCRLLEASPVAAAEGQTWVDDMCTPRPKTTVPTTIAARRWYGRTKVRSAVTIAP